MTVQLTSDQTFMRRLLPTTNTDPGDRALAWNEWYIQVGEASVMAFIRVKNDTLEPHVDIFQEAMATAFVEVERGRYKPCTGVPLTAYVKGIAYNKIREARRRKQQANRLTQTLQIEGEVQVRSYDSYLDTLVEQRERREALRYGLSKLPQARRAVLEAYLDGKSTSEIAQNLEMTEALVRQHKSRGLRRLRAMAFSG